MDPETLRLLLFAESMAALAAKTIADLKNVISGSHTKDVATILDDADTTYNEIISRAKSG